MSNNRRTRDAHRAWNTMPSADLVVPEEPHRFGLSPSARMVDLLDRVRPAWREVVDGGYGRHGVTALSVGFGKPLAGQGPALLLENSALKQGSMTKNFTKARVLKQPCSETGQGTPGTCRGFSAFPTFPVRVTWLTCALAQSRSGQGNPPSFEL